MGPEQWLFLQWHEHKGSLVSTFEKLFERNVFVDCTLAAEGQQLNVHKMILSACSPYFEILLNENRDKHPIIILKDVKFRSLKSIIEYMYRGEANVLSTEIKDFLSAAETLQIKGLGKQDGGDNRGQPAKDLRDLVEESLPPCSTEMPIGIGEKENWRGPDHLSSVLSEAAHENAAPKNILFSQGDMGRNISPQKIPVQALCAQEIETEKPWLKTEGIGETSQCLKSVLPTLNLGTHSIEPVHPGSMDQVPEKYACSTSIQNVQKISDVQMDMEMAPKHEPEHAVQSTSVPPDNEEAETASIVSSVIELSDTTEEWAEEDMEEGPTGSQATANSFAGGTDESRAHFDGASDATRDSVSRDLGSDQQALVISHQMIAMFKSSDEPQRTTSPIPSKVSRSPTTPDTPTPQQEPARRKPKQSPKASCKVGHSAHAGDAVDQKVAAGDGAQDVARRLARHRSKKFPEGHKSHSRTCRHKRHARNRADAPITSNEDMFLHASTKLKCALHKLQSQIRKENTHSDSEWLCDCATPASGTAVPESADSSRSSCRKTYLCPVCQKSFPWLCHLKIHLETHKGDRLYKCEECAYVSTKFSDYMVHQRLHMWRHCNAPEQRNKVRVFKRFHSAERPYKCTMWDYMQSPPKGMFILTDSPQRNSSRQKSESDLRKSDDWFWCDKNIQGV